ncbi:MAG: hypothetical protein IT456_03450 [Planctomycetes bacterium]|nr:hypothetical protein [Planctomycetota bacterium]
MNTLSPWCSFVLGLATCSLLGTALRAQCGLEWQPGELPGADGRVWESVLWDPDGAGPRTSVVVCCGAFRAVGPIAASGVAAYDPLTQQWSAFGAGVDGEVHDVAVLPNGNLVVAGAFATAGGVPAACVAVWNGTAWSAFGTGVSGGTTTSVDALAVAPNGDLIVGGTFTQAGGVAAANLASWNGTSWTSIGGGITGFVDALTHLQDGSLIVAGQFSQAGAVAVNNIARWDGTAWSSLAGGLSVGTGAGVKSLQVLPDGRLVAGGLFGNAGGVSVGSVAIWDGAAWATMQHGLLATVYDLELAVNGDLLATSYYPAPSVMRWNGTTWSSMGPAADLPLRCITALPNGDLFVGGEFSSFSTTAAFRVAYWNGSAWSAMVPAAMPYLQASTQLLPTQDGGLVAMRAIGAASAVSLARWDGATWQPLSAGLPAVMASPVIVELTSGELVLSGPLRWSGSAWVSLPGAPVAPTKTMLADSHGGLVIAMTNVIVRWNGVAWSGLTSMPIGAVYRLAELPNGDLIAAGSISTFNGVAAQNIVRFDGSQWLPLGAGVGGPVNDLAVLPNGDLVVSGTFTTAGGLPVSNIARWNGTSWSAFGSGMAPVRLASLQNGEVLAVGALTINGVTTTGRLARGDGVTWTPVDGLNGPVTSVTVSRRGVAYMTGTFTNAGGHGSAYIASLASNCPATASEYGAGCAGSAGVVALSSTSLPWIGGRSECRATNLAANSVAFGLIGFAAASTPLSTFHPAAGAGCTVLTSPLATVWMANSAATATLGFTVPNDPALVAVVLRQQVVQAEFGLGGAIALLSSSNGVQLTVGAQ